MRFFSRKAGRQREAGQAASRNQPSSAGRSTASVFAADLLIAGNVDAAEDLHLDGRVEGDVRCRTLTQGAASEIVGAVTADTARLGGSIEGMVRVRLLTVERGARVTGDIEYENITIEDGGQIDGRLNYLSLPETPVRQI